MPLYKKNIIPLIQIAIVSAKATTFAAETKTKNRMRSKLLSFIMLPLLCMGQTLEECQQAAERNYPLIRQYELIEKTADFTVANIQKGWLPQLTASARATLQSDVTAFPDELQQLYQQMGITMQGLNADQYRLGIDVQQTVYDGGSIRSQKEIARRQGEVQLRQNEVNLYAVRRRVNEMFFALLLVDEQLRLNADLQTLLESNEQKLAAMRKGGTAAECDWQNVRAERLGSEQQRASLQAQRTALVRMLAAFCGMEIADIVKPSALELPADGRAQGNMRPELKVFDAQVSLVAAQEKALDAALMPRVGVFAQGYYGYPGYNMFEDMMCRKFSWNGMIGARLTWNIGALYTRKTDKAKLRLQREAAAVGRERFLFDNHLEQTEQSANISRCRQLMADDAEIIALRAEIRRAAESKLAHGIIDANDLVREINNENKARVEQCIHEIEMLKAMHDWQTTVGE